MYHQGHHWSKVLLVDFFFIYVLHKSNIYNLARCNKLWLENKVQKRGCIIEVFYNFWLRKIYSHPLQNKQCFILDIRYFYCLIWHFYLYLLSWLYIRVEQVSLSKATKMTIARDLCRLLECPRLLWNWPFIYVQCHVTL